MSELKSWRPVVHGLLEPSKNDLIQQLAEKATIYDMVWRFPPGYHNCFIKEKLLDPESRQGKILTCLNIIYFFAVINK